MIALILGIVEARLLRSHPAQALSIGTFSAGAFTPVFVAVMSRFLHGATAAMAKGMVPGDTVGDSFKNTANPSLNILIKLMSIVALVFAPLFA